jgi:hypothetical protein
MRSQVAQRDIFSGSQRKREAGCKTRPTYERGYSVQLGQGMANPLLGSSGSDLIDGPRTDS